MKHTPLLLFLLLYGFAEAQTRNGRDYAVFFPVTDYAPGSGWGDLEKTLPECKAIAADLESTYGFVKPEVLAERSANQIIDKLVELAGRKYGPQDQLLLFFSMHGHFEEAARGGSLVPTGGTSDPRTWLLHSQLDYYVTRIPCPHILIALDACYSGTFSGGKGMPGGVPGSDCSDKITNALQNVSCLYLAAGGKEKVPADSDFARRWRSALGSRGGEDGILSFLELQLRLSEAVPTPKWGTFGNDLGGSFVFVSKNACTGGSPPPRDPDQAAIENARRQNTEEGWQLYLDTWPRGRHRAEAEQALFGIQEERVWQAAERAKSPAAYQNYKAIYCPGGRYCADVEEHLRARPDGMILIPGGSFQMGSDDGESNEKPVHSVAVGDFYLGKYEVTVAEFRAFVEAKGYKTDAEKDGGSYGYEGTVWEKIEGRNWRHDPEGKPSQDKHPVINVSWNDATAYCQWLSQKTGQTYRLPTEAEWEYAAGNGSRHTQYIWGNGDPSGKKGGNVADKTAKTKFSDWTVFENYTDGYVFTAPVGSYDPNEFGLHDMSGNVWEWCSDWYGTYPAAAQTDPKGPDSGFDRVVRGGSWYYYPQYCRVAFRSLSAPGNRGGNVGFRLARTK
jgi:formylglycine-generating enzyme